MTLVIQIRYVERTQDRGGKVYDRSIEVDLSVSK